MKEKSVLRLIDAAREEGRAEALEECNRLRARLAELSSPSSPTGFDRQQLELRASLLESDVVAAVKRAETAESELADATRDAGIYRDRMEAVMDERDKLKDRLQSDVDGPGSRLGAWQARTQKAEGALRAAEGERDADMRRLDWLTSQQWFLGALDANLDWRPNQTARKVVDVAMETKSDAI